MKWILTYKFSHSTNLFILFSVIQTIILNIFEVFPSRFYDIPRRKCYFFIQSKLRYFKTLICSFQARPRFSNRTANFHPCFPKEENCGGFLFGMKTYGSKLSSQWLNLEQIWPADISPSSFLWSCYCSIPDHFIINVAKRGKNTNFFKCCNDE